MNNEKFASDLAEATIELAKLNSHPVVIMYDKLKSLGEKKGVVLEATEENGFEIWEDGGMVATFDTIGDVNEFFKSYIGEGV